MPKFPALTDKQIIKKLGRLVLDSTGMLRVITRCGLEILMAK